MRIKHLKAALAQSWKKVPGVTRKKRVAVLISGTGKNNVHSITYKIIYCVHAYQNECNFFFKRTSLLASVTINFVCVSDKDTVKQAGD